MVFAVQQFPRQCQFLWYVNSNDTSLFFNRYANALHHCQHWLWMDLLWKFWHLFQRISGVWNSFLMEFGE